MERPIAAPVPEAYDTHEVFDLRGRLIAACFAIGILGPLLCWLSALLGYTTNVFPHDKVAVTAVLFSVYAPLLVFINNKGETRARFQQLVHFAWLWFFSNTVYQVGWEMPWFLLKDNIIAGLTEHDVWYWPWWAYGVADTRYLKFNELSITISAVDGSVALLEVFAVFLYFRGYRILVAWLAFVLGACMGWGQYLFYLGEVYGNFVNVEDGFFGMWIKFVALNLPWLIFPFFAGVGFIWYFAVQYKKLGVQEYLANGGLSLGESFAGESEFLTQTDAQLQQVDTETNKPLIKHLIVFALIWPVIFLSIDIYRYYFG